MFKKILAALAAALLPFGGAAAALSSSTVNENFYVNDDLPGVFEVINQENDCDKASCSCKPVNWYCKRSVDGVYPELDPQLSFVEKYNTVYVNRAANEEDKVIYLTFDAGYENGNVEKILDVLKKHKATGAFFLLDHVITENTDLVKRMFNEGHLVCNHTLKHRDMSQITDKNQFAAELASLEDICLQYTGNKMSKFFRPPQGCFSETNLRHASELGYTTVFWSFAYADWDNDKQPDPEKAYKKLIDGTHNGEILLLHPTSSTNAQIMDRLLTEWEKQGYRFGSLNELAVQNGGNGVNEF